MMGDMLDMNRFTKKDEKEIIIDFKVGKFDCVAVRSDMGHWCGYVILPPSHKYYKGRYNSMEIDCHGGLTFGDSLNHYGQKYKDTFAIGWDYAHYDDINGTTTEEMVREECANVARQLS